MWRVCSEILTEAQAQGATVILAGDLNVTMRNEECKEARAASAADNQALLFVEEHGGRVAERAVGETDFTWNAMASGQEADLNHVVAFLADIQMSRK
eukprot:379044-Rhodomonas_salina.1